MCVTAGLSWRSSLGHRSRSESNGDPQRDTGLLTWSPCLIPLGAYEVHKTVEFVSGRGTGVPPVGSEDVLGHGRDGHALGMAGTAMPRRSLSPVTHLAV